MVERKTPQFKLEPKIPQDQKPPLRASELSFEQQARSPLDEARFKFVLKAIDKGVHLLRPQRVSRKVFRRHFDIVKRRILEGESKESVAQGYRKPINWVDIEVREGLDRLWSYSPEQLRTEIPRETILPSRCESNRLKRKAEDTDLVSKLQREDINKEELRELVPKVGIRFYERNRDLFDRLGKLLQEAGHNVLPASADLSPIAKELEQDGGIVLFSFSTKVEGEGEKVHFLVLKHDRGEVLHDLRNPNTQNTQKDLRPHPSGLIMYQSF